MQVHHWWWILTLVLGVAEILTGTFYLLVLALGSAAGGIAAWLGATLTVQICVTAAVAIAGWVWLWRRQHSRGKRPAPQADPDMLLDVGGQLRIDEWTDGRHTRVPYRGAQWAVELDPLEPDAAAVSGIFIIARIDGSRLIVRRAA